MIVSNGPMVSEGMIGVRRTHGTQAMEKDKKIKLRMHLVTPIIKVPFKRIISRRKGGRKGKR